MTTIADQLRALADEIDRVLWHVPIAIEHAAGAPVPIPAPASMVAVRPTGPKGRGKVRYYPDPATLNPHSTLLGYVSQIAERGYTNRDTMGRFYMMGDGMGGLPHAEIVDRMDHPDDWKSQGELDQEARVAAAHAGAGWVSSGNPDGTVSVDMPIPED